jgi:hypothetical protein
MKIPAKLLTSNVDDKRFFAWWKLIHAFCPKRNRESEEKHRFDQDNGEFQMRRDAACDTSVICDGTATFSEANQDENKKRRPTKEERAHEPVAKLEDMIDLISM